MEGGRGVLDGYMDMLCENFDYGGLGRRVGLGLEERRSRVGGGSEKWGLDLGKSTDPLGYCRDAEKLKTHWDWDPHNLDEETREGDSNEKDVTLEQEIQNISRIKIGISNEDLFKSMGRSHGIPANFQETAFFNTVCGELTTIPDKLTESPTIKIEPLHQVLDQISSGRGSSKDLAILTPFETSIKRSPSALLCGNQRINLDENIYLTSRQRSHYNASVFDNLVEK